MMPQFFGARGPLSPQAPHCLDDVAEDRRIHRVYVPSARTKPGTLLGSIRKDIDDALAARDGEGLEEVLRSLERGGPPLATGKGRGVALPFA